MRPVKRMRCLALRTIQDDGASQLRRFADRRFERFRNSLDQLDIGMAILHLDSTEQPDITRLRPLLAQNWDMILANGIDAIEALSRAGRIRVPILLDLGDRSYLDATAASNIALGWRARWRRRHQEGRLSRIEAAAARQAQLTFVTTPGDREDVAALQCNRDTIAIIRQTAFVEPSRTAPAKRGFSIFTGSFGHAPDVEAAERLMTLVWPRVRTRLPDAELVIAGDHPDRLPSFGERPAGIRFVRDDADSGKLLAKASLAFATQTRRAASSAFLVESAMAARAIIATSPAAEGLSLHNGRDLLLRNTDAAIADSAVDLLENETMANALGLEARRSIEREHQADVIETTITEALRHCFGKASQPSRGQNRITVPARRDSELEPMIALSSRYELATDRAV
jgi:hypothetical protein